MIMKRENYQIVRLLLFIIVIFFVAKIGMNMPNTITTNEGTHLFFEELKNGLEAMTNTVVEELVPMKTMMDRGEEEDETPLIAFLAKEFLPALHFEWGYDAVETLAVDNQNYLYLMEENEEENQKEMQQKELNLEVKTNKENKKEKQETLSQNAVAVSGRTYSKAQLYNTEFLMKNFYVVESTARLLPSEIDGKTLLNKDLTIQLDGKKPKILIYHTHGSESFKDSRANNYEDTVIGVGTYLTKLLEEKYHIPVYHDKTVYDIIDGKLDRSLAYNMSLKGVEKILKDNPSIDVVIDLHRDGLDDSTHLVTEVNGKPTAKVMIMNGVSRSSKNGDISYLYNANKQGNLAFSLQMQLDAEKKYPTLMRKIYIKTYRYNLHVKPRAMLIEAGANTNTLQEVKNAMEPIADMLNDVLRKGKSQ